MEVFLHFIRFFIDGTIRWTTKMLTVVFVLTVLWLLNDTFDFIHSYRTSNKLEHLEKINQLLSDTTLNKAERQKLLSDRYYAIHNKSLLDYLSCFSGSFSFHTSRTNRVTDTISKTIAADTIKPSKPDDNKTVNSIVPIKNYWLHFLFSNIFLIVLMISIPYFTFQQRKPGQGAGILIIVILIIWAGIFFFCMGIAWLLNLIPVIYDRPWINYILDFSIQSVFWFTVFYIYWLRQGKK